MHASQTLQGVHAMHLYISRDERTNPRVGFFCSCWRITPRTSYSPSSTDGAFTAF